MDLLPDCKASNFAKVRFQFKNTNSDNTRDYGGWTHPGESEAVDAVRQHVAEQGGVAVEGGEVSVHVGGLPVGHPRHDAPLHVGEDGLPVLTLDTLR